MILETTVIVSRRDANTMPVIHVRDEYQFESEQEQRVFTDELLLWMDDRPVPGGIDIASFPRKGFKGELSLMQTIDKMHGPDSIWDRQNENKNGKSERLDELDVPEFLKAKDD